MKSKKIVISFSSLIALVLILGVVFEVGPPDNGGKNTLPSQYQVK